LHRGYQKQQLLRTRTCSPNCSNSTPPVYRGDYSDELDAISADGTVDIPTDLGLGVKYDWEIIEDHQTGSIHVYE